MNLLNEWLIFAKTKRSVLDDSSLRNLIDNYELLMDKNISLPQLQKLFAEICFLIAQNYKSVNIVKAYSFAEKSIDIYKHIQINSLEDATPILQDLLPDLMHEDVVHERIMKNNS